MRLLWFVAIAACSGGDPRPAAGHFDPPSGTVLPGVGSVVRIVGLDGERICATTDGTEPAADCEAPLDALEVAVPACGFNVVKIAWAGGTDQASYVVESAECEASCDPVVAWSNDELVRAFALWQDEVKCRMNGCQNPSGTGDWSADCDSGRVVWDVSLDGLRAISRFDFEACEHTVPVDVIEGGATVSRDVRLVVSGTLTQDTDFSGNGNEAGVVDVSGDFEGQIESKMLLVDKARGGGAFAAGCTSDPLDGEACAPSGAAIAYDWPDWACHGDICPEASDGGCLEPDADLDGVPDTTDNCAEVVNTDQTDVDADGLGDACDDEPGFVLIRFAVGERCLTLGDGAVHSTSTCAATDPDQQWVLQPDGDGIRFQNLGNGECLGASDSWIGPWTVQTEACDGSDSQKWRAERYDQGGLDAAHPIRLHNAQDDFCVYTDLTGLVYGTIANCGLAGTDQNRKAGLYFGGDFTTAPWSP